MSDTEHDSRALAVGRKRKRIGEHAFSSNTAPRADSSSRRSTSKETTSRRSSLESGEISSTGESHSPTTELYESRDPEERHLTASTTHSAREEEELKRTKSMSAVESSGADNTAPDAHAMSQNTAEGVRICELSDREIDQQELYFDLNVTKYPDDLVYCMCCGARGHMDSTCSKSTCEHCGAKKAHASYACPSFRKCRLCRKRGHDAAECTNASVTSDRDPCDICEEAGHVEEECPRLWSTCVQPDPLSDKIRKIPDRKMIRACYSCGSNYHWGDDCQYSDRNRPRSLVKTWSMKFANQFVLEHDSSVEAFENSNVGIKEEEQNVLAAPAWQLAMFDDGRD